MILSRHFFTPGHHLPSYAHYPTLHYYMDESPISLPSTEKPTVSFIFIHSLFSIYAHECALIHVTLRNLHTRQEKKELTNLIQLFSTYFLSFSRFQILRTNKTCESHESTKTESGDRTCASTPICKSCTIQSKFASSSSPGRKITCASFAAKFR